MPWGRLYAGPAMRQDAVMAKPLPEKRKRFVEAYLRTGNGTQAATEAGYAAPNTEAVRLLADASVAAAIKAKAEPVAKHRLLVRENRLEWLAKVIAGEETEAKLTAEGEVVETPAVMKDRLKAADMVAKMLGEYARAELPQGPTVAMHVTGNVTVADMTNELRARRLARLGAGGGDGEDEEG